MIQENQYFNGRVKSLGFNSDGQDYTAGVILPGEYVFETSREEHITVVVGKIRTKQPNKEWVESIQGDRLVMPAHISFTVQADEAASYICLYK